MGLKPRLDWPCFSTPLYSPLYFVLLHTLHRTFICQRAQREEYLYTALVRRLSKLACRRDVLSANSDVGKIVFLTPIQIYSGLLFFLP